MKKSQKNALSETLEKQSLMQRVDSFFQELGQKATKEQEIEAIKLALTLISDEKTKKYLNTLINERYKPSFAHFINQVAKNVGGNLLKKNPDIISKRKLELINPKKIRCLEEIIHRKKLFHADKN